MVGIGAFVRQSLTARRPKNPHGCGIYAIRYELLGSAPLNAQSAGRTLLTKKGFAPH
jgi:hypothetical protein